MAQDWSTFKVDESNKSDKWSEFKVNDKTNNNGPQAEVPPKSGDNTSLNAPATDFKLNMSDSNKRDEESIDSDPKVAPQVNLEANGASDQHNIIKPEEHDSLLTKGWKLLNPSENPEFKERLKKEGITGIQGPELMKIPGLDKLSESIRTKGRESGNYTEGFASSILGDLLDAVSSGFDPRTAGTKESPMDLFPSEHLPENTPIFRSSKPSVAAEQFPKEVPSDVAREFAPVGEEGNLLIKNEANKPTVNSEDRLLELAKQKQGMGLDNPNLVKSKATYFGEQPTGIGDETMSLYNVEGGPLDKSTVSAETLKKNGIEVPSNDQPLLPPSNTKFNFNQPNKSKYNSSKLALDSNEDETFTNKRTGEIVNDKGRVNKPRLTLTSDGSFINNETGESFDMRGHRIDSEGTNQPGSLIDATDKMNNSEITHEGGPNILDETGSINMNKPELPDDVKNTTFSDIINFPKALKASWDLSAPGRQGLGLIHRKEWWSAWNDMFQGMKSEEAFKATQKAIENRPLFKSFNGEESFAQKSGLKLTNLGKLDTREEAFMSKLAEKFPGVKTSERAYTAYLNKLRADTFENMLSKYKVLGENGEYNMPLAKDLANYINNATGRGSLGSLESSAVALNNAFFSPRFFASRLKLLGEGGKSVFTPSTYVFSQPSIRREYLKSLLAIAGVGVTVGELAKMSGLATVEHDPTNSDFMKIKVGNTRLDPYAGMQQPIVLASRLLSGKSTSSVSGKTSDLTSDKFGSRNRMDVAGTFARSKESPLVAFAHNMAVGKDITGKKFDLPEDLAQLFIPMIISDLKQVATENSNLIPYYHEEGMGLENTNIGRGMLALPGLVGVGVSNYPSKSN